MPRKKIEKSVVEDARQLFLSGAFSQRRIAEILNVTEKTISEWKERNGWAKQLDFEQTITENVLELLAHHTERLVSMKRDAVSKGEAWELPQGDSFNKYANYVKRPELKFEQVARIMKGFFEYLAAEDVKLADEFKKFGTAYLREQQKALTK